MIYLGIGFLVLLGLKYYFERRMRAILRKQKAFLDALDATVLETEHYMGVPE